MSYRDECMDFAATLAVECKIGPSAATRLAVAILKDAATVQRHAEDQCNRQTLPQEDARAHNAFRRICLLLAPYPKVEARHSGDPRGLCVKLTLPSGHYNNWDGETYGVPVATR